MRSRFLLSVPVVALLAGAFISAAQTAPQPVVASGFSRTMAVLQPVACEKLAGVRLPDTTITAAETVKGGSFTPPGSTNPIANLPPFCRVAGAIKPTKDSDILFEVWLPLEQWNGKLAGVGNGGWAGTISFGALGTQIRRGYAAASTNTGHVAVSGENMAKFAFEHPEQLTDFAYRSHHELATKAKAIAQAVLRQGARARLFRRVLVRRLRRVDGSAAVPGGLRRHRRRRTGEQLDAAHGGRLRRTSWPSSRTRPTTFRRRPWRC